MGVNSLAAQKKLRAKKFSYTQPATTANTYATVLNQSGSGNFLYIKYTLTNAYNINYRITIDGTVISTGDVFSASSYTNYYFGGIDGTASTTSLPVPIQYCFKNTLLIEVRTSTSAGTNHISTDIFYNLES